MIRTTYKPYHQITYSFCALDRSSLLESLQRMISLARNVGDRSSTSRICFGSGGSKNREFKQRRRRRRGRRLVKNEFIFHKQNSRLFRSARYANSTINVFKPNMQRGVQFQIEIRKISRRRPRTVDDAELGHFTFLLC